ncbi:uncharacterized protein LOC135694007 [Rhopilema esculentum]|uniref:uncharacterized protein LOC135694007 n=1 Tax=Rhopilema esculentum TaxID=499914 RepID=UPI0031CEACB2
MEGQILLGKRKKMMLESEDSQSGDSKEKVSLSSAGNFQSTPPIPLKAEKTEAKIKATRWLWNDEMTKFLIVCLHDYKKRKELEGIDIQSDLVKMYEDVRQMMAALYPPENFGPVKVSSITQGLNSEEHHKQFNIIQEERKSIKLGYGRIREKVKKIRRNFRTAIREGTRSESGRVILQNWEYLMKIWGECPSEIKIEEAITPQVFILNDNNDVDEQQNHILLNETEAQGREVLEDQIFNSKKSQPSEQSKGGYLSNKKRAKMDQKLSAQQQDMILIKIAKEELEVKKNIAEKLEQSAKRLENVVETMAKSLTSFGEQLNYSLMLLSQSIASGQNAK